MSLKLMMIIQSDWNVYKYPKTIAGVRSQCRVLFRNPRNLNLVNTDSTDLAIASQPPDLAPVLPLGAIICFILVESYRILRYQLAHYTICTYICMYADDTAFLLAVDLLAVAEMEEIEHCLMRLENCFRSK